MRPHDRAAEGLGGLAGGGRRQGARHALDRHPSPAYDTGMVQIVLLSVAGILFIGAIALLARWLWRVKPSAGRESFDIADD